MNKIRKIRKIIQQIIKEELCNAYDYSSGFITKEGEYVPLSELGFYTHGSFIWNLVDQAQDFFEKGKEPTGLISNLVYEFIDQIKIDDMQEEINLALGWDFIFNEKEWIRVANAFAYEGPSLSKIPISQINTMIALLNQCGEPKDYDGDSGLYIYELERGKTWADTPSKGENISTKSKNEFMSRLKNKGKMTMIGKSMVQQFHTRHDGEW